jgi:hypothetical protein
LIENINSHTQIKDDKDNARDTGLSLLPSCGVTVGGWAGSTMTGFNSFKLFETWEIEGRSLRIVLQHFSAIGQTASTSFWVEEFTGLSGFKPLMTFIMTDVSTDPLNGDVPVTTWIIIVSPVDVDIYHIPRETPCQGHRCHFPLTEH